MKEGISANVDELHEGALAVLRHSERLIPQAVVLDAVLKVFDRSVDAQLLVVWQTHLHVLPQAFTSIGCSSNDMYQPFAPLVQRAYSRTTHNAQRTNHNVVADLLVILTNRLHKHNLKDGVWLKKKKKGPQWFVQVIALLFG